MKQIIRYLCYAGLLLSLSGCSMLGLAYRYLDWFILHEIDDYLDLSKEQKAQLKSALDIALEQHRHESLPRYVVFFDDAAASAQNGLQPDEIEKLLQELQQLYAAAATQLIDLLVPLLADLSPQQIRHLQAELKDDNREQREDYGLDKTRDERYAMRIKEHRERVEFWSGSLSSQQAQMIAIQIRAIPDSYPLWQAYHYDKQQTLLILLQNHLGEATIRNYLLGWWLKSAGKNSELSEISTREIALLKDYIYQVDASLNPKQRKRALKKLRNYADALAALIPEAKQLSRSQN